VQQVNEPTSADQMQSHPQPTEQPGPAAPPEPLHTLFVCDGSAWSRLAPVIRRLAVGLLDSAAKVSLLRVADCPPHATLLGAERILDLPEAGPIGRFFRRRRLERLVASLRQARIRCVHATALSCLEVAAEVATLLDVPTLATVDSADPADLQKLTARLGPRCLAASLSEPLRLAAVAACRDRKDLAERVRLVRPGIHPQEQQRIPFEPGRPITAVVLEPLARDRRFHTLLRAAASVNRKGHPLMLFFLSTGPAERDLRKLAAELKISEQVTFTGRLPRWAVALQSADMLVVPAPHSRFHFYPLEAAADTTLLLTARGHIYDFALPGRTAVEFSPDSAEDLADRILELANQPHAARSIAYAAQEHIKQNHSVSRMTGEMLALYAELIAAK